MQNCVFFVFKEIRYAFMALDVDESRLMDEIFLYDVGPNITNWNPTTGTVFVWYELFTYLRRIRMSSMTHNNEMFVTFFYDDYRTINNSK